MTILQAKEKVRHLCVRVCRKEVELHCARYLRLNEVAIARDGTIQAKAEAGDMFKMLDDDGHFLFAKWIDENRPEK